MSQEIEIWKTIPGWSAYEASSFGRIRRIGTGGGAKVGRILKTSQKHGHRYADVNLSQNGIRQKFNVHILIALTFIGPANGLQVCHFDSNRINNRLSNLRYDTATGNMADSIRIGAIQRGETHGGHQYSEATILKVKKALHGGMRVYECAKLYGVSYWTVWRVKYGKAWAWLKI